MTKKIFTILLLLVIPISLFAAEELYPFTTKSQSNRFKHLTTELRCLVCQNETIAESSATLAADLRELIYQKISSGQTDQQIISYLTSRYGNFILYQPPLIAATIILWIGPLVFLILALFVFYKKIDFKKR